MADRTTYLAFDLGAESGRAVLGILADGRVELQEIHRFPNTPCLAGSHLHWDALYLFNEMKKGLAMAAARAPEGIASLGIDTWGVDFGLLDAKGELLSNPVHYRDARTNGILERAFEIVPRRDIFEQTGIQFLQFNSLFQLIAMREAGSPLLDAAENLLMMPDLFNYWFTGRMAREFTNATTTQCYDTRKNDWAWPLIDAFKLPRRIFGEVSAPATILAPTSDAIAAESGVRPIPVALPATHDTGSAVIAVPAEGENWAYISCGTWALIGVETSEPVINARSLEFNFTNEGGAFGTNRLLCNVMGLWLLQQSRRTWARGRAEPSYAEIVDAARNSPPLAAWIDPDDPLFFNPPDMVAAITQYCRRTNQEAPEGIGPVARCIIESLALKYRYKIERIEEMTGRTIAVIHIVGGGSRNELLCQATADACNRQVVAGPAEATALGNVLTQAVATGEMRGLDE
ncbi:rhamnulokinase, partial [Candidatus Sumerlaeota bacterium]|nr:rhamnulokinase [Candidatus Sumerlaeota bacterium]